MPPRSQGQRQNLFAFVTMGLAMPIGFLVAGKLGQAFHLDDPKEADYRSFFFIAAAAMTVLLVLYWFSARITTGEKPKAQESTEMGGTP